MIKNVEDLNPFFQFLLKYIRVVILLVLSGVYILAFVLIKGEAGDGQVAVVSTDVKIVKLVDVQEFIPEPPKNVVQVQEQPKASEVVQEVEEIVEQKAPETNVVEANQTVFAGMNGDGIEYLPQHKITEVPVIPTKDVLAKIVYPSIAYKQGIEGVVYLELYIDDEGNIRKIEVLKDPGHGFADAAVDAFKNIKCEPAKANGKAVPVRFRYPVRFKIN